MGFLLSPAFSAVSRFATIAPLEEYRKLAEWPKAGDYFGEEKLGLLEYTKQLNTWFSDNFATRPFWVRTYTKIQLPALESYRINYRHCDKATSSICPVEIRLVEDFQAIFFCLFQDRSGIDNVDTSER